MSGSGPKTRLLKGELHVRTEESDDDAIASVAFQQQGMVARSQLLELLIGRRAIEHRVRRGRLVWQYRGVYAVGLNPVSFLAKATAAVLSVWPEAAGSHWAAAAVLGLCSPGDGPIHVTCPRRRSRRDGIVIHHAALPDEDLVVVDDIPVTSVERTILELASSVSRRRARRLMKQAEFLGLTDHDAMAHRLARHRAAPGHNAVVQLLPTLDGLRTRSGVEDDFQDFCKRRNLPLPETNVAMRVGDTLFEVDCLWRDARLVVELDTVATHGSELAFHDDRARDRALSGAGWRTVRVTDIDLEQDPDGVEADLRAALRLSTAFRK